MRLLNNKYFFCFINFQSLANKEFLNPPIKRSSMSNDQISNKKIKDQIDLIITVGNTYEYLKKGDNRLKLDLSGKYYKHHSWTLYTKCTNDI